MTSLSASAQWTGKYKAGMNGGHEWNIFLNPPSVQTEDATLRRNDLWINGYFSEFFVNADFKKNTKDGRLKWGTALSGAVYSSTINANRHSYKLYGSYRKKYAPRKYFEFAPEFLRTKRQGVNDNDAVLATPFSYTRFTLPFKLDFYRGNLSWLKTAFGYRYKAYDQTNTGSISYHAGFAGLDLSKKWRKNQVETKLTFSTNLEVRAYRDSTREFEEFDPDDFDPEDREEADELDIETRLWTYVSNDLVYEIKPLKRPYELSFGLYTTLRLDRDQRNAYREWAPGISGGWDLEKVKLRGSLRYVNRSYPNRQVGESESPLTYQFVRASVQAEVPLTDHWDFRIRGNMINRKSSNTARTRAFRGYFNSLVEVGVVLKL